MSEPPAVADELEEVVPGVFHWRVSNARIGGATSASHAIRAEDGATVLVDPIRLAESALEELKPVTAIVLTAACHQRSSWRYRERFGASVYLPRGSRETDEEPDREYEEGDQLPGSLEAIQTPGPERPHYSLLRSTPPAVLFCPDLLMVENGELALVPGEYHENPDESLRSIERLLDVPFDVLCLAHGPPITNDPKTPLRDLIAMSPER